MEKSYKYYFHYTGDSSDLKLLECSQTKTSYHRNFSGHNRSEGHVINGFEITVAVLDSSINVNHDIFKNSDLNGMNFIPKQREDYWCTNREYHGTMVAGILASVAPRASIYLCCVSDGEKRAPDITMNALDHLIEMKKDGKKLDIVIMSFGRERDPKDKVVLEYEEKINQLYTHKVISIAAVGNQGCYQPKVAYPARLKNVLAVGSVHGSGSEPGKHSDFNPPEVEEINVYAPGEGIACPAHSNNKDWIKAQGTSCSAPAIGGVIAKLKQFVANDDELRQSFNDVHVLKKLLSAKESPLMVTSSNGSSEIAVLNPSNAFESDNLLTKLKSFVRNC